MALAAGCALMGSSLIGGSLSKLICSPLPLTASGTSGNIGDDTARIVERWIGPGPHTAIPASAGRNPGGVTVGYEHLQNTLKAIALTIPAARAFEMTVEFVLGQGRDTATVGRLEDHFRDRPALKTCVERLKAGPAARKRIAERYMG